MNRRISNQFEYVLRYHLIEKQKSQLKNSTLYYIEFNGQIYKHHTTGNMFFKNKRTAMRTLVRMIKLRLWEFFAADQKQAENLIYYEVLHLIRRGDIKIKSIIINSDE